MATTTIRPGAKGIDFLGGFPPAVELVTRDITFVATYLKNHQVDYVDELHAHGIAWLPIWETKAEMMLGGAPDGTKHAGQAVAACRRFGIPEGTTIIFAHDTSAMNPAVVAYNVAAEKATRALNYRYGGYGGRGYFDQCMAAGVAFDLIWATNATAWLGGRHPGAHVWQGKYQQDGKDKGAYDQIAGVAVDKNVCQRPFAAWGPAPPPVVVIPPEATKPPTHEEDVMDKIVTNSQPRNHPTTGDEFAIGTFVYLPQPDGTLRYLDGFDPVAEADVYVDRPRLACSNDRLDAWLARKPATVEVSGQFTIGGSLSGSGSINGNSINGNA